ncbi:hypothetical protein [Geodermatophilus sp. SYSU D00815]
MSTPHTDSGDPSAPAPDRLAEERPAREMNRRQLLIAGGVGLAGLAGAGIAYGVFSGGSSGGGTPQPTTPSSAPPPPTSGGPAPTAGRRLPHPFWTEPLPAEAPLAATSDDYVARLAFQAQLGPDSTPVSFGWAAPYNTAVSTTDYSLCIYTMPADWPRTKVYSRREKTGLQEVLDRGVPVPDPADLPDGNIAPEGTDGAIIIIQGTELWEFWQFGEGGPSGYDWSCEQGGHMADYTTHPGWWAGSSAFGGGSDGRVEGYDWGVSACGQSYLGGILTAEDFYADAIRHPLPLALPITGAGSASPSHLLPATRYDQNNFTDADDATADPYRLPEGARFRLPADFDIEGWVAERALPPEEAGDDGSTAEVLSKVLVCLRDYGLFIAESAGIVGFSGEHEKVYGTPYHPYPADQIPLWGNFGQQLPWSSLVQVEPPTTDISVPASDA